MDKGIEGGGVGRDGMRRRMVGMLMMMMRVGVNFMVGWMSLVPRVDRGDTLGHRRVRGGGSHGARIVVT